jgi:hypothetical protein
MSKPTHMSKATRGSIALGSLLWRFDPLALAECLSIIL